LNKINDLKVHPMGESKKFNIARDESKEKELQRGKTKLAYITGGINQFTLNFIFKNKCVFVYF
jgi:hypothetical protein